MLGWKWQDVYKLAFLIFVSFAIFFCIIGEGGIAIFLGVGAILSVVAAVFTGLVCCEMSRSDL